jgi:hypothetical protein
MCFIRRLSTGRIAVMGALAVTTPVQCSCWVRRDRGGRLEVRQHLDNDLVLSESRVLIQGIGRREDRVSLQFEYQRIRRVEDQAACAMRPCGFSRACGQMRSSSSHPVIRTHRGARSPQRRGGASGRRPGTVFGGPQRRGDHPPAFPGRLDSASGSSRLRRAATT